MTGLLLSTTSSVIIVGGLLLFHDSSQAFHLPMTTSSSRLITIGKAMTSSSTSSSSRSSSCLFYRNSTSTDILDDITALSRHPTRNNSTTVPEMTMTTTTTTESLLLSSETYNHDEQSRGRPAPGLSLWHGRRQEVIRPNVHPMFKLEFIPIELPMAVVGIMTIAMFPLLVPLLPLIIMSRKFRWEQLIELSKAQHSAEFEETTLKYRQSQHVLVGKLLEEEQKRFQLSQAEEEKDSTSTISSSTYKVIAVTMATGQEGQGVVKALSEAPQFQNTKILALVRNPTSIAAQALAKLNRVELVECDSTDSNSLKNALKSAQAVFLCTTLNRASAGLWEMNYNGAAQYQITQGYAIAEALSSLGGSIQQVVYGTAPLRKWPSSYMVEPPIHYAAKWRVEEILREANLPVTFLRKCPYHENFTKLTKAKTRQTTNVASKAAMMGVGGGAAFFVDETESSSQSRKVELEPGNYKIKAMTPSGFSYNMMDPRDIGKWAVLAFSHPNILIGESLSVASDAMTGPEMAQVATDCGALGEGVTFSYEQQPRWLFETLAFVEPTFVYISGLQRWNIDGGLYDLDKDGVNHVRQLIPNDLSTWSDHLAREGLGQFTETMEDLLPDFTK